MSPTSTIRRAGVAGLLWIGITIVCPWLASAATPATLTPRNTPLGLSSATYVDHAEPDRRLEVVFTLDLRDHAGADALIEAQQDPDSPLYHQWIAPEEFQARFGPTANDLKDVKDFHQLFVDKNVPISRVVSHGNTVSIYANDPDGNSVEVYWPSGIDVPQIVATVREKSPAARIVAFGSHVDVEALSAARAAGCDEVMPNSQFDRTYVELLRSAVAPG